MTYLRTLIAALPYLLCCVVSMAARGAWDGLCRGWQHPQEPEEPAKEQS